MVIVHKSAINSHSKAWMLTFLGSSCMVNGGSICMEYLGHFIALSMDLDSDVNCCGVFRSSACVFFFAPEPELYRTYK